MTTSTTALLASTSTVALGPLRRDLVATYVAWENDPLVKRGFGRTADITAPERAAGLEAQLNGRNMHFTLYSVTEAHLLPVGTATLAVDQAVAAAEYSVCLGPEGRGRGLAAPLTRLVLHHGFTTGKLHNVLLAVLEPNTRAVRAYERAGFRHVGRRRDSGLWDGIRCHELIMDAVPADLAT